MGRAPCCEKMGLKKGPWTPDEDRILINYVQHHGHGNWRRLPKLAGLLRCGKSCRLRWTNYLRPDIKRGNFSREEEDTIIQLHEMLGNRWSAIAARLPGRTDNEIKNVWHTHLKKRLRKEHEAAVLDNVPSKRLVTMSHTNNEPHAKYESHGGPISSPQTQQSSSSVSLSSTTTEDNSGNDNKCIKEALEDAISGLIDENFWSELVSSDDNNSAMSDDFLAVSSEFQSSLSSNVGPWDMNGGGMVDCFWYDLLKGAELADV
ncbi:transcription factor MYB13 [Eucalyptus grandis]|uniref:Uncharacterized protein n=2 Tax=Eucalyptus grandis TaxID=71139 RepID=A0ACC3IZ54_EUCGR|nr:transcription factor MYB13 [Eucalyptus grandis]KAK3407161.1 hypothetical protein EUGRSUZ_K03262 [Eucalyptus grandis]